MALAEVDLVDLAWVFATTFSDTFLTGCEALRWDLVGYETYWLLISIDSASSSAAAEPRFPRVDRFVGEV